MAAEAREIWGKILFAGESEGVAELSTPTVFTGQRLRGTLLLSHQALPHSFETVNIILKGTYAHALINRSNCLSTDSAFILGTASNVMRQADGLCWKIEKPVSVTADHSFWEQK